MKNPTRRSILKSGLIAGALTPFIGLISTTLRAAGLPLLDPQDPTAKALGFEPDATKINVSANPTFKPGQQCGVCLQFQGKASDASGGCSIFAGHSVPSSGWCKVWVQKPS